MFKIISKNKYEAMLTQIEGLKSINDRLFSDKNKLRNECISLKRKSDGYVAALENLKYIYDVVNNRNLDLKDSIKALSDELSKWKRNRDLVTGRFIKNRK